MRETTLCYIRRGTQVLMLHRTKKQGDANHDKWIGIGGGIENGETPDSCLMREVLEETGLTLTDHRYRGVINFYSDRWEDEVMHLYTADGFTGSLIECDEGELEWIEWTKLIDLTLWEGDLIFLRLIEQDAPFFRLDLRYEGEHLAAAVLDGVPMKLAKEANSK